MIENQAMPAVDDVVYLADPARTFTVIDVSTLDGPMIRLLPNSDDDTREAFWITADDRVHPVLLNLAQLCNLANIAADDICDAAGAPDTGVRDALNLLVNTITHRVKHPTANLADVVDCNYGDADLPEVLRWINS